MPVTVLRNVWDVFSRKLHKYTESVWRAGWWFCISVPYLSLLWFIVIWFASLANLLCTSYKWKWEFFMISKQWTIPKPKIYRGGGCGTFLTIVSATLKDLVHGQIIFDICLDIFFYIADLCPYPKPVMCFSRNSFGDLFC